MRAAFLAESSRRCEHQNRDKRNRSLDVSSHSLNLNCQINQALQTAPPMSGESLEPT
jgi:hypothetical protein